MELWAPYNWFLGPLCGGLDGVIEVQKIPSIQVWEAIWIYQLLSGFWSHWKLAKIGAMGLLSNFFFSVLARWF